MYQYGTALYISAVVKHIWNMDVIQSAWMIACVNITCREFFERQAGSETTIEFFKQSEQDDSLFVALKFESREIAKDILNR